MIDNEKASFNLAKAWKEGIPEEESVFLKSLSESRASEVLTRLAAVLASEGDDLRSLDAIASDAGLGRTLFYNLRMRWKKNRTLRALTPYEPRTKVEKKKFDLVSSDVNTSLVSQKLSRNSLASSRKIAFDVRAKVEDELRTDPMASNGAIVSRVIATTGKSLDRRTLGRFIRQERRRMSQDPAKLKNLYGRSLLIDISAVDLLIMGQVPEPALLALVIDRGSATILGFAVGLAEDALKLQAKACLRAIQFLSEEKADVPLDQPIALHIVIGPSPDAIRSRLTESFKDSFNNAAIVASGPRRFGIRAASWLGRIGRLHFRPWLTQPAYDHKYHAEKLDAPALSIDDADTHLETLVKQYNLNSLQLLKEAGCAGVGHKSGEMSKTLAKVCDVLL